MVLICFNFYLLHVKARVSRTESGPTTGVATTSGTSTQPGPTNTATVSLPSVEVRVYPLARHEAPAEGEGANIDRRLVPYHGKCKRIQSHIEFIDIFIYLYHQRPPHARHRKIWPW